MISPDLLPGYLPLARERLAVLVAAAEEEISVRRRREIAVRMGYDEETFVQQWESPHTASGAYCRGVADDLWRHNIGLSWDVTRLAHRVFEAEAECRGALLQQHWTDQLSGWSTASAADAVGFTQRVARLELALLGQLAWSPRLRLILADLAEDFATENEYSQVPLFQHVALTHAYATGHLPGPRVASASNGSWLAQVWVLFNALEELPGELVYVLEDLGANPVIESEDGYPVPVDPSVVEELRSSADRIVRREPEWRGVVEALTEAFDEVFATLGETGRDTPSATELVPEAGTDAPPPEPLPTYLAARRDALRRRWRPRNPVVAAGLREQARLRARSLGDTRAELVEQAMVLAWAQRSAPWTPRVNSRCAPIIPSVDLDDAAFVRWFDRETLKAAALLAQDLPYPLPRGYADHEHTLESEVGPSEDSYSGDRSDEYNSIIDLVANNGEDERWGEAFERWDHAATQRADDLVVAYALMTPGQKRMVAAWFAGARSWADAAKMLGIAEGAVHTQLQRIRAKLDPAAPAKAVSPPGRQVDEYAA